MMRQTIDEYLDGVLDAQARAAVEQTLARDPAAAKLAATMKAERAVRAAVYASYQPTQAEASAFAAQVLAVCEDEAAEPVGRIAPARSGGWLRYASGVAAAMAIALTAFGVGRMTAPASSGVAVVPPSKETVALYVVNNDAPPKLYHLSSMEEAESVLRDLEAPADPQIADASDIFRWK